MKRKAQKILVTDASFKHTLCAIRCLGKAGYSVDAIGGKRSLSGYSRYLSKISYSELDFFSEEKIDLFLDFLSNESYDVLLPIGSQSIQLISQYFKDIQKFCKIPLAPQKKINLCFNKNETVNYALNQGINVPKTWDFHSFEELLYSIHEIVYPVVIKGRHENYKEFPQYSYDKEELLHGVKHIISKYPSDSRFFPIIQQYINGQGCGLFALYQSGTCKRIFMHRRIRENPASGGASCCAVSIYEKDLLNAGKTLLDGLKWHGVAMVEFKRENSSNELFLMEINPKFWGSLDLAVASGVNFPVLDASLALGEEIPYSNKYSVDLKYHWLFDGELEHLLDKPQNFWPILEDTLNPRVRSNLIWEDPLPGIFKFYDCGYSILTKITRKIFTP